ncbi:MAG: excinuclease ABC subunit UvrA [Candidatus Aminicenantia bacterium]
MWSACNLRKDMSDYIILRGVRVNNLKNINLDIPLNKLIVITGVSGSGKSSLAFDTLYAEGQRRYIESLSSYVRQFFEKIEKPDADIIEGITPAIAIQQRAITKNPRSTVATVTEIWDYMRILFARIGTLYCHKCGSEVRKDNIDSIVEELFKKWKGDKVIISFPYKGDTESLRKKGFYRFLEGTDASPVEDDYLEGDVIVDRLIIDENERERIVDSLETAMKEGMERVKVRNLNGEEDIFSGKYECKKCLIIYEEPDPNIFSFNSPQGACERCHGFGDIITIDEDKIIPNKDLSLEDGAIEPWTKPSTEPFFNELLREARKRKIPVDIPYKDLKEEHKRFIMEGDENYYGVKGFFEWLEDKKYKVEVRVFLHRYRKYVQCPICKGSRLRRETEFVKINGKSISEVAKMTVERAYNFFNSIPLTPLQQKIAETPLKNILKRLEYLLKVGLDYITLDRMTFTLSGGEAQRINLALALGSSLVGVLFALDEPSIGLHPRDNQRLIDILKSIRDNGNTVVVVEHDPQIIKQGDVIIDLGPRGGEEGGYVMFSGEVEEFLKNGKSITAEYLREEKRILRRHRKFSPSDFLRIYGARKFNLKNINVKIPLNSFTCITGVSGSGKSTLLYEIIYKGLRGEEKEHFDKIQVGEKINDVILVDQTPLTKSSRSIPISFTKAMDEIRNLFASTKEAKIRGFTPSTFSFNVPGGRCEECKGAGKIVVEMQFLSDVVLTCEECGGKRYKKETLEVSYKGKNITEVLDMSVSEAIKFFSDVSRVVEKLLPLEKAGLGYLRLGQPISELSGGENQRLKLAYYLNSVKGGRNLFLLDEPTTGLHLDDINKLMNSIEALLRQGNTIVIIEHNLDLIKLCDWIIDLGPEGGERGGKILYQGLLEGILKVEESITGKFLREIYVKDSYS